LGASFTVAEAPTASPPGIGRIRMTPPAIDIWCGSTLAATEV
jgi:hypothetical protein